MLNLIIVQNILKTGRYGYGKTIGVHVISKYHSGCKTKDKHG